MISCEVVYPIIGEYNNSSKCRTDSIQTSSAIKLTTQIRIEGCHYQLSEVHIRSWLGLFGMVQGDVVEEAIKDSTDGSFIGTATYLTELIKRLPNFSRSMV
jgi:hypothetical protein